jgi:hypothetical protein
MAGEAGPFTPAFTAAAIDVAACRQLVDGESQPVDPAAMLKALGLGPGGENWEEGKWTVRSPHPGQETGFAYLVVLKQAVAVGTLVVEPADAGADKRSRTGGELFWLKPTVSGVPDPADATQWQAAAFAPAQPFLRFAVLPPGTTARAFLYRDRRSRDDCQLGYWRCYRERLGDLTPLATVSSAATADPAHAGELARGGSWRGRALDRKPAYVVLAWDRPIAPTGVFSYSNASRLRFEAYAGPDQVPPAVAPEESWRPLSAAPVEEHRHVFPDWAYSFRWFALTETRTRAIRVRIDAIDGGGSEPWISGFAVLAALGGAEAPKAEVRDDRPPLRIPVTLDQAGEGAAAVEGPDGTRVRNLFAMRPMERGAQELAWDLRDEQGAWVAPGRYTVKFISAPPLELRYELTPYPNVDQLWRDRSPWLTSHNGHDGWLSDHTQMWCCATSGDRLWFGAPMAEAGVCLIECGLDGEKQWGRHDFGAWTGVNDLAADDQALYVQAGNGIHRLDQRTRESKPVITFGGEGKSWQYRVMAARAGKVAVTFGGAEGDAFSFDCRTDTASCRPTPANEGTYTRLLRLWSTPPGGSDFELGGQSTGNGRCYLESTNEPADTQYWMLAFQKPTALGGVALPVPAGMRIDFSVLKPGAAYPPALDDEAAWSAFPQQPGKPGWTVLAAPADTVTRALRLRFHAVAKPGEKPSAFGEHAPWFARLEGMKLLRRRFADVATSAQVRVGSGAIDALGAWDAKRSEPIAPDKPGVYVMQWPKPVTLRGLAFQEIDGARTEIDVWQGPLPGEAPLSGEALGEHATASGWRKVADYRQRRRRADYQGEVDLFARYLDGYVDFGKDLETAAVRLRVVEQWLDNGDDGAACRRAEVPLAHGSHIKSGPYMALDTRACRILGVAALSPLGGDPAGAAAGAGAHLAIYDGTSGALERDLPVALGWHGLAFAPDGRLYAINHAHTAIVRVDTATGATTEVVKDCRPSVMTIGPDGCFYVRQWSDAGPGAIAVYAADGTPLRTIGKPGGLAIGPWDAQRIGDVYRMCVTRDGSLFVVETQNDPRRVTQWRTDGTFVKEILGNTWYGGGGTLDRTDRTRAYFGALEFAIDPATGTSRIRNRMAAGVEGDLTAVRVEGRTYLVTTPLSMGERQDRAVVYLKDEAAGTVRMVGAIGDANNWWATRTAAAIGKLAGDVPRDYVFAWSDLDGDGRIGADEIAFRKKDAAGPAGAGRFDERLGVVAAGRQWELKEILPNGTPVWRERPLPHPAAIYRLESGDFLALHTPFADRQRSENFAVGADGRKRWGYPAHGGVSGLSIAPWAPGVVGNQFAIIGHEHAAKGDLGEFFVTHANTGQWLVWTADGLLAGEILLHRADPRARLLGPSPCPPGTRLDPLSASQEHFHGCFTRTEPDGAYRIVMGFTTMSILAVDGLERFERATATIEVRAEDVQRARAWAAAREQGAATASPLLAMARQCKLPPQIDGVREDREWPGQGVPLREDGKVRFDAAYDAENLYLCWSAVGAGRLANAGGDFHRLFKTGAALDLFLQTDPAADPARTRPAAGDLRLLLSFVAGKPVAVLYQPVAKGAKPEERWRAFTPAGGETAFDRVVQLDDVELAMKGPADQWTVEAAIPLEDLGLVPAKGMRLRMDWGLVVADGLQVKDRIYWSNRIGTGISDEAVEARLEPQLWGFLGF